MGSSLSTASLGGLSPYPKGSYVCVLDNIPESDREELENRPTWTEGLEKYRGCVGLVTGGASAESRASCVAFVDAEDDSVDWFVFREEWLRPLTDEEVKASSLTDSDRARLDAFFTKTLCAKVQSLLKEHSFRATKSVFGPTGTIVRVRKERPSNDGTGVDFAEQMVETLGVCGIVVQGAITVHKANATFVAFPFPVGFVYGYSDEWLEPVDDESLDQEEREKLFRMAKTVEEAVDSFGKDDASPEGDEEKSEDLPSLLDKLKRLRKELSDGEDSDEESDKECSKTCGKAKKGLNKRKRDGVSENLADQLRESHQRELDLTRRLCALEARSNDFSALQARLAQIEAKLDTLVASVTESGNGSCNVK